MTQSSCKRDTKSKSHPSVKLAPVRVFSCKHPLTKFFTTMAANLAIWLANLPLSIRVHTTLLASMCRAMPFSARALKIIFDVDKSKCGLSWSVLLSTTSTRHYCFPKHFFFLIVSACWAGLQSFLRWLTRVFLRLDSARYHRLPNVSINRAFTNDSSNPKKKGNHFGAWKTLNHFGISSNSFKLHLNMCLNLGPKKGWQKTL